MMKPWKKVRAWIDQPPVKQYYSDSSSDGAIMNYLTDIEQNAYDRGRAEAFKAARDEYDLLSPNDKNVFVFHKFYVGWLGKHIKATEREAHNLLIKTVTPSCYTDGFEYGYTMGYLDGLQDTRNKLLDYIVETDSDDDKLDEKDNFVDHPKPHSVEDEQDIFHDSDSEVADEQHAFKSILKKTYGI